MPTTDLYFIANPGLGIIKIGITQNLEARRRNLEFACGVPLEVMKVVVSGGHYEADLHEALAASRLIGEWFSPTPDLFGLIHDDETIPAFLKRTMPAVKERRIVVEAAKEAALATREIERAELKRIEAEREAEVKRLRLARDARKAKARAKAEAEERERIETARREWLEGTVTLDGFDRDAVRVAAERRAALMKSQRGRNIAHLGLPASAGVGR